MSEMERTQVDDGRADLLEALKKADEILRRNPDADEPPRYRNARAAKIIQAAIAKAEGRS